jgi:hypothetical protein
MSRDARETMWKTVTRVVKLALCAAVLALAAEGTLVSRPGLAAEPAADKQPSAAAESSDNLSERLNRSGGVIKPPENVDPGLQKKPPDDSGKMPVIPPPGTPGGDPNVKPK